MIDLGVDVTSSLTDIMWSGSGSDAGPGQFFIDGPGTFEVDLTSDYCSQELMVTVDSLDIAMGCSGGCQDDAACNFDVSADFNDGSCTYPGLGWLFLNAFCSS